MGERDSTHELVDLILASAKKEFVRETEDGRSVDVIEDDYKTLYYMTRQVNSPNFSNFVFHLEQLSELGNQCEGAMSIERANEVKKGVAALVRAMQHSIDGKMSESLYNKHNKQKTTLDIVGSSKSERIYTMKGEDKKSLKDIIFGSESKEE